MSREIILCKLSRKGISAEVEYQAGEGYEIFLSSADEKMIHRLDANAETSPDNFVSLTAALKWVSSLPAVG